MERLSDLLRAAGIAADPTAGPRAATGTIYTLLAPDAQTRDAWLERLSERAHESGRWALRLGRDAFAQQRPADEPSFIRTLERAARLLEQLDRYQLAPPAASEPDRVAALRRFAEQHPAGAALSDLLRALADAPASPRSQPPPHPPPADPGEPEPKPVMLDGELELALFPVDSGAEALALYGFGGWNSCPHPEHHVARAMRWARDFDARLDYLGPDRYGFRIPEPPHDRAALQRLADEHSQLHPDEKPHPGALHRLPLWRFWWD